MKKVLSNAITLGAMFIISTAYTAELSIVKSIKFDERPVSNEIESDDPVTEKLYSIQTVNVRTVGRLEQSINAMPSNASPSSVSGVVMAAGELIALG